MKVAQVGIIATAVLAVATLAFAQKPDFSGMWTLDPEATGTAGGAPPRALLRRGRRRWRRARRWSLGQGPRR